MGLKLINRTNSEGRHRFSEEYVRDWCTNYKSQFIRLGDVELHYRDEGTADKPVLVLLHGFGGSLHGWDAWVRQLEGDFRILRIDLPGFGLSTPLRRKVEIGFFVDVLHQFLEAKGIGKTFVAGNSLGGWLAWEYTCAHPERIEKLVLLNAAGYFKGIGKPKGVQLIERKDFRKLLRSGVPRIVIRQLVKNAYHKKSKIPDDVVRRTYMLSNREGMLASIIYIASSEARSNVERIKQIEAPTLILWGENDQVIKLANAHKFYKDIPRSFLRIYKDTGHVPMMECPEQSAEDTRRFLLALGS